MYLSILALLFLGQKLYIIIIVFFIVLIFAHLILGQEHWKGTIKSKVTEEKNTSRKRVKKMFVSKMWNLKIGDKIPRETHVPKEVTY